MKDCDNSTCKLHISNNFILSISLLIMFDTLLLRPSLYCNTLLHFTTLHPTTLHNTTIEKLLYMIIFGPQATLILVNVIFKVVGAP